MSARQLVTILISTIISLAMTSSIVAQATGDEVRAMLRQAETLINTKDFKGALKLLNKAKKLEPQSPEVHGYLGMAYQNSMRTQKAIPEYIKALELNPSMSFVNINLGTCYMNMGKPELAVPYFKAYLRDNPNSPNRAMVEQYIQQSGARKNQGNLRSNFEQGQSLLNNGQTKEAFQIFSNIVRGNPNWGPGHFYLAYSASKLGNHRMAVNEFMESYRLEPTNKENLINIGSNYQSMGDTAQAITWYQKFLSESPGSSKRRDIEGRIRGLKNQAKQANQNSSNPGINSNYGNSNNQAADYMSSVSSKGKFFRWPPHALPLRVYIASGNGLKGYNPGFNSVLQNAFLKWQKASANKLVFIFVNDQRQANINCFWTDNPNQIMDKGRLVEGGLTKLSGSYAGGANVSINNAVITILTLPRNNNVQGFSEDELMKVCLHEVGHALGLNGHSNNNKDIMFYTESPSIWPALTKRDKATIQRLYSNYPQFRATR